MQSSAWKCPKCKQKLFVSNSGDYWCSTCQAWKPAEQVDPMNRDFVRNLIVIQYAAEKALYQMGETG